MAGFAPVPKLRCGRTNASRISFVIRRAFALLFLTGCVSQMHAASPTEMKEIPGGTITPLIRPAPGSPTIEVPPFLIDTYPVTNAEFLAFVTANPTWRRSRLSGLFADPSYLEHWSDDLTLGPRAPVEAPVVDVSWFAARAYARWKGKRLPTTAEWEFAATAGYSQRNGREDAELNKNLYAWLARPSPAVLPDVTRIRADFHGVYGLHGLVWEWVDDFNTAMLGGESRGADGLDRNLFCGTGSLNASDTTDYAAFARQALRSSLKAKNTTASLGFRCARDISIP